MCDGDEHTSLATPAASIVLNTTSYLSELPVDLIVLIASYCSMKDQRTLSHCNKSYRSIMRTANLIRYKLSRESSRRYVDDLSFRDVVDSRGHVWAFGECAFYGCRSLTSIILPSSLRSIGNGAFYYCISLRSIEIPSLVESIGDGAFYGCSSLTSIILPSSLRSIGINAFADCSSLRSIEIPSSVESIGDGAFRRCSSLTSVTVKSHSIESYERVKLMLIGAGVRETIIFMK